MDELDERLTSEGDRAPLTRQQGDAPPDPVPLAPGAWQPAPVAASVALAPARRWATIVLAVVLCLALGALGVSGYLAWSNKERADLWQVRADALERNVDKLNGVLVERSDVLNARTRELNRMASKVGKQQTALRRSEADVASLAQRQRALAAEKAKVEDSRAALAVQADAIETVASAFIDCKDGLFELLDYILADDYYDASAISDRVFSDCGYAESTLSTYNANY